MKRGLNFDLKASKTTNFKNFQKLLFSTNAYQKHVVKI